jgi:hypothetical protein
MEAYFPAHFSSNGIQFGSRLIGGGSGDALRPQFALQPARLPAGLQNRELRRGRQTSDRRRQKLRLRHLEAARDKRAGRFNNTDMSLFEGNVQTDIMLHGRAPLMAYLGLLYTDPVL